MGILTSRRNSGRASALFEFTQGIDVDCRLAAQEIRVQKAWSEALGKIGVLSADEVSRIHAALAEALTLMEAGDFAWEVQDEDIHMNLERFVTEKAGTLGKKMHIGRSRNDLIATTLRLYVHDTLGAVMTQLTRLVESLLERASKDIDVLVPGLTHVQHGQPIRQGHALAAHAWAFYRDLQRLSIARERSIESMPLGAAALSGTTLAMDFEELARKLGFTQPCLNSYDSVGDRDFVIEALSAFAAFAVHLSRLSEDCILWSSTSVGLIKLPKAWSTGSSIMPNKRNPDVPELARGKSAHLIAAATNGLALMKAVPTSYGSDLHELKGVYMRALDEASHCLSIFPDFVAGLEPDAKRAEELLAKGHILATEIADELTRSGLPFREAYAQVASLVERAEALGCQVERLPETEWKKVAPSLSTEFIARLSPKAAVEKRTAPGGTSLARANEGIDELRSRLRQFSSRVS
jgi:argininosuccinate lyase